MGLLISISKANNLQTESIWALKVKNKQPSSNGRAIPLEYFPPPWATPPSAAAGVSEVGHPGEYDASASINAVGKMLHTVSTMLFRSA